MQQNVLLQQPVFILLSQHETENGAVACSMQEPLKLRTKLSIFLNSTSIKILLSVLHTAES
jgi:hypothetical protein